MKLERLFIRFDDGENPPLALKCSTIVTIQQAYYHPIVKDKFGIPVSDILNTNPLLCITCSNSIIVKIQDITLDEFMRSLHKTMIQMPDRRTAKTTTEIKINRFAYYESSTLKIEKESLKDLKGNH